MGNVGRHGVLALLLGATFSGGCGEIVGFDGAETPLVRLAVHVDRPGEVTDIQLRVALVWAAKWLPEPFCVLPAESDEVAAVIAAGCRDSFGFAPKRVAANAELDGSGHGTLELFDLPGADVMVGDVTARIAYGSFIVYAEQDENGTLDIHSPRRGGGHMGGPPDEEELDSPPDSTGFPDAVYGGSFLSMTRPDQRLAFREGEFSVGAAFYPRGGCEVPPKGFSLLSAGGFTREAAFAAVLSGQLPQEEAASCATASPDEATVAVSIGRSGDIEASQSACRVRGASGTTRYREPPGDDPRMTQRIWACAALPRLGTEGAVDDDDQRQLVVAAKDEPCKSVAHYTLRGCDNDPGCDVPEWDRSMNPPAWWPCTQ